MKYHFIAIGGSVMHNLAIALKNKGNQVSGSDDEIFEPSLGRLKESGLLPDAAGWNKERIKGDLDAIILGMHAKADNPELIEARRLGIPVYSFPEFLYEQTRNKTRVVISGSHGKTTITSMVMHVLKQEGILFDYLVGAKLEGFDVMVGMNEKANIAVFEGDEYLTSPLDPRPKFHLYHPDIALVTGIAWDHYNVFPTFENYLEQFMIFVRSIEKGGIYIYYEGDKNAIDLLPFLPVGVTAVPYREVPFDIQNGDYFLVYDQKRYPLDLFGLHNIQNIAGAWKICGQLGVSDEAFLNAIATFRGASRRLEKVYESKESTVYWDFAHAPSKVRATVEAVRQKYPERRLVACLELHTYSSLSKDFLTNYGSSMHGADIAAVYFNPHAIALKGLKMLDFEDVRQAFAHSDLHVFNDSKVMQQFLKGLSWTGTNLLMMSSGDFDGIKVRDFSASLLKGK
ncbi:MAG: peptidoglycan synthetase [Bacteroidetes bacterium]|nr:peptidoglycan synthetase [Bacteroidota bacterium]